MLYKSTPEFKSWLNRLKDLRGRARIQARIERLAEGNPGKHRNLRYGVSELKLDVGPGYRVYYTNFQGRLIILLCGGDKASQPKDIERAYQLAKELVV